MSSLPGRPHPVEIHFPPNVPIPTYFANVVQTGLVDEEAYLDFCVRSPERPLLRADLQCRVITSVANLRRLTQSFNAILAQHDEQVRALAATQSRSAASQGDDPGGAPTRPVSETKTAASAAAPAGTPGRSRRGNG